MIQKTFIPAVIALAFGLSGAAHAAVVNDSSFNASAEILGTTDIPLVGSIAPLSVSVTQGGTVNLGWPLGEIGLNLGFDGTIIWTLSNITLDAGEITTGVTQIGGPVTSTILSCSDTSVNIVSNTLLELDLSSERQTFELTTAPVVAPVPLPAALPLLLGGLAALGGLRLRRKKT